MPKGVLWYSRVVINWCSATNQKFTFHVKKSQWLEGGSKRDPDVRSLWDFINSPV